MSPSGSSGRAQTAGDVLKCRDLQLQMDGVRSERKGRGHESQVWGPSTLRSRAANKTEDPG